MTLCLPLTPLPAAVLQQASRTTSTQPGWAGPGKDRSGLWLRNAAAGLCVLAAAAAAVSFTAQYRMADAARHLPVVAALEASIPDAAALVFACLGVALALHGRRALRPRALNLAAVGTSVFMNAIAAAPGWRNLAIWAMPPIAYALASDTLVGVVRARALARHRELDVALAAEEATPLAIAGGLIPWHRAWPWLPPPPWPGSAPGCWRNARSPPAAAPLAPPGRPLRPGRAGGEGRSHGRRRRPPGSFLWSPNGTGHSPPSPFLASPPSAPRWPQRPT